MHREILPKLRAGSRLEGAMTQEEGKSGGYAMDGLDLVGEEDNETD